MRHSILSAVLLTVLFAAPVRAREQADMAPATVTIDLGGGVEMKFVRIPKGTFWMGSPNSEKERRKDEEQHEVELTGDYYVAVTAVTQEQYMRVTGKANPSYFSKDGEGKAKVAGLDTSRFPVETVSWQDSADFCRILTEKFGAQTGARVGRKSVRFSLPSEAEWEYACRGGEKGRETQPFHFKGGGQGTLSAAEANFNGNFPYGGAAKGKYLERPQPVGSYEPNRYGLYDMHGNVFQWCEDWYDENYYANSVKKDPKGTNNGSTRVVRGGSWGNLARGCRAASRYGRATPNQVVGCRACFRLD